MLGLIKCFTQFKFRSNEKKLNPPIKSNQTNSNQQQAINDQQTNQRHDSRSLRSENENPIMAPVRGKTSPRPTRIQLDAVRPKQILKKVSNGVPVAPRDNPGQALGEDGIIRG